MAQTVEETGLEVVQHRYTFFRDRYILILRILFVESVLLVVCVVLLSFMILRPAPVRFFATTTEGRLIPLVPLDEPNMETGSVLSWCSRAASQAMTWGFHDHRERLMEARRYFTQEGWAGFLEALEAARVIGMVEKQRMVVSAVPQGAPILVEEGRNGGIYYWIVEMPLLVTWQGSGRKSVDHLLLRLCVVRTPVTDGGQGLGISRWIAREEGSHDATGMKGPEK